MTEFIKTRATQLIENAEDRHSVVTYQSHKSSRSSKKKEENKHGLDKAENLSDDDGTDVNNKPMDKRTIQEKEMKRFRYDVIKFGMSGYDKETHGKAKMALAIRLGAKPPKNRAKNYKEIIAESKRKKVSKAKEDKFSSGFFSNQLLKMNKKNIKVKKKTKHKKSNEILKDYGQVTKNKPNKKRKGKR